MSAGGRSGRRHRGGHEEEHENHERWLVSYADMMTLLMVLFVVMFAISQVDQRKFAALKNGLAAGFGAKTAFNGGVGSLDMNGQDNSAVTVDPGIPAAKTSLAEQRLIREAVADADRARAQQDVRAAEREVSSFRKLRRQISRSLRESEAPATVRFAIDERGLVITVLTSSVVFAGDRAELLPAGQRILAAIGSPLRPLRNRIEVDGHTNQLNVPTRRYPTAWELSTARASTVVRYLADTTGIPGRRLSAAGFAGERPLYPPTDPRSVTLNRRVEVVVLSTLPAQQRALLPVAAGTIGH